MAGGNAIIAAVMILVAAAVGLTPPTVALLLMTAELIGLFIGSFTPSTATILELGGSPHPQCFIHAGLPMSLVTFLAGCFMSNKIQQWTVGKIKYDNDVIDKNTTDVSDDKRRKRSALVFFLTVVVMAFIDVIVKAGFSFAIFVMLTVVTLTGLSGGLAPIAILDAMYKGCVRLVRMFLHYWLYNPVLVLVDKFGAYQAFLDDVTPYLQGFSATKLCFFIFLFNIIGHVPRAAVAQMTFTKKLRAYSFNTGRYT